MRVDRVFVVTRTSWNESSDFWTEHEYDYPDRRVEDPQLFSYLSGLNDVSMGVTIIGDVPMTVPFPADNVIATYTKGFLGDMSIRIDKRAWDVLGIDVDEGWPDDSDNAAELSIEDDSTGFHKYAIEENGMVTETDWVEVSDEDFDAHEDDLGMMIVVKPYGAYEDESVKQATPVGMAHVNNPQYGQWKQDAQGSSFWEFYGRNAFVNDLLGGTRAYYGRDEKTDTYGTHSAAVQSAPRYRDSAFGQQGGFRIANASVRGAGPSVRGGGPGGGGK